MKSSATKISFKWVVSPIDNESEVTEATPSTIETITKLVTLLDTTYLKDGD